jgi:hypothetical protein
MSDTELTDVEVARLQDLLQRAADALPVTTPDIDSFDLQPAPHGSGRGRWMFAAAAALVVLVAAVGAVWLLSGDDAERIDTGPAEPPVTVAPEVLEQTGVWRLPEGLDDYRVVGAQDGGLSSVSSADRPGVLAVDDPDEPQRWLLVQAYDELGELPPETRVVPLSEQVEVALMPTTRSTWFRVTPTGVGTGSSGELVVSGTARGLDEAELLALLAQRFGTLDAVSAAGDSTASMEAMLDDAGVGEERLVWKGGVDDPGPGGRDRSMELTLVDGTGPEVVVVMAAGTSPPWAQVVRLQMVVELMSLPNPSDPSLVERSIRARPELGRSVIESAYVVPGEAPVRSLAVLTDDGVLISVSASVSTDDPTAVVQPTEELQLRIINSLRAMSEDEFRARLAELEAEFIGAESVGVTTTVVSGPGG